MVGLCSDYQTANKRLAAARRVYDYVPLATYYVNIICCLTQRRKLRLVVAHPLEQAAPDNTISTAEQSIFVVSVGCCAVLDSIC